MDQDENGQDSQRQYDRESYGYKNHLVHPKL